MLRRQIRSAVAGIVTEVDQAALKAIRSLKSYQSEMIAAASGKRIEKTIDLVRCSAALRAPLVLSPRSLTQPSCRFPRVQLTSYGNVNLVNESLVDLERDYAFFHDIVEKGIFRVE